jgi:hypothetical protein
LTRWSSGTCQLIYGDPCVIVIWVSNFLKNYGLHVIYKKCLNPDVARHQHHTITAHLTI